LDLWVSAVASWVRPSRYAGLKARQPLHVMFEPGQQEVALEFEKRLILNGLLAGRRGEHETQRELAALDRDDAIHDDLAALVRPGGPLTPEVYAAWVHSGVRLSPEAWERHLSVVLESMR
jgi:hypothetical protein